MDESLRLVEIDKAARNLPKSTSPSDFDKAGFVAETTIRELLKERELTWKEFCGWYLAFFQTAGHRRLGAVCKRVAQEFMESIKDFVESNEETGG